MLSPYRKTENSWPMQLKKNTKHSLPYPEKGTYWAVVLCRVSTRPKRPAFNESCLFYSISACVQVENKWHLTCHVPLSWNILNISNVFPRGVTEVLKKESFKLWCWCIHCFFILLLTGLHTKHLLQGSPASKC